MIKCARIADFFHNIHAAAHEPLQIFCLAFVARPAHSANQLLPLTGGRTPPFVLVRPFLSIGHLAQAKCFRFGPALTLCCFNSFNYRLPNSISSNGTLANACTAICYAKRKALLYFSSHTSRTAKLNFIERFWPFGLLTTSYDYKISRLDRGHSCSYCKFLISSACTARPSRPHSYAPRSPKVLRCCPVTCFVSHLSTSASPGAQTSDFASLKQK